MIYKIKEYKDKLIEKAYKDGMRELNKFFGFGWTFCKPNICVLNNRKEFDLLIDNKTPGWLNGFADGKIVYVLDNNMMEKESDHKKLSNEVYYALIKHELCHLFYNSISNNYIGPAWLTEGLSLYLADQIKEKKPVIKFSNFLEFYENGGGGIYAESGMAVKLLVEKFGKKKLLKLISKSGEAKSKKEFAKLFKKIYSFDLNYKNFNNLLNKK